MAKIVRPRDKIKLKLDDIVLVFSPLTVDQKADIQEDLVPGQMKMDRRKTLSGVRKFLKCSLKEVQGVECLDGSPYKLVFVDGHVSDECVDDLYNLSISTKLEQICTSLSLGVRDNIEGVELVSGDEPSPN